MSLRTRSAGKRPGQRRRLALRVLIAVAAVLPGCAPRAKPLEPQRGPVRRITPAKAEMAAQEVQRDPVAYLRRVAANCRRLQQYTLLFTRSERRGLLQQLQGPEHIRCWFRREPFSVRMKWLDDDCKYGESVYVAGQADGKVRFVTRWWSPPLLPPPGVNKVDLQTPVAFGESKRPLTDFGLERMMERTVAALEAAGADVVVSFVGLEQLPDDGPTVHHLRLEYPPARYRVPTQDLYIDVVTNLPAGTLLKLASGALDASYFYADLDSAVRLTDDDFLLAAERTDAADEK